MKPRTLSLGLVAVALPLLSPACDDTQICTDAGCGPSVSMAVLAPDDGELPEGEYEVSIGLDGQTWTTTCSTADPLGCTPLEGPTNTFGLRLDVSGNRRISVEISEASGDDVPSAYTLQVAVEGELRIDVSGKFAYETSHPNGPDCGPTCESAASLSFELMP